VGDGGVAVAIAEMAIGGRLGVEATVPMAGSGGVLTALTNEAAGRLLLESPPASRDHLAARLGPLGRRIGVVTGSSSIEIAVGGRAEPQPVNGEPVSIDLDAAVRAFTGRGAGS